MATRTLKAKYETQNDSASRSRIILCHSKNTKEIHYEFEDEAVAEESAELSPAAPASAAPAPVAAPVAALVASSGPVSYIPNEPLKATDTLRVIILQKLKKGSDERLLSKTVKDLVGGKTTSQIEIFDDLQLRFASAPEKAEEMLLEELGAALGSGCSVSLGKYTSGMVSHLVASKLPGGFNPCSAKSYLSKTWGIGSSRADAAVLLGSILEPEKRLGSEAEAKERLDSVVPIYAQCIRIFLSQGIAGRGGGSSSGGAMTNTRNAQSPSRSRSNSSRSRRAVHALPQA